MLMCSKCGKRPAVVFISQMGAHDHNDGGNGLGKGLCIVCAKEAGIPQVDEYIKRMGISDEDLEEMANATSDLFDEGESFENGGSSTLPELFGNLMGNVEKLFGGAAMPTAQTPEGEPAQSGTFAKKPAKDKPKPKLKYLNTYCTNLSEKAASGFQYL